MTSHLRIVLSIVNKKILKHIPVWYDHSGVKKLIAIPYQLVHASQSEDDDKVSYMIIELSVSYEFKLNSLKLNCSSPSVMVGGD